MYETVRFFLWLEAMNGECYIIFHSEFAVSIVIVVSLVDIRHYNHNIISFTMIFNIYIYKKHIWGVRNMALTE